MPFARVGVMPQPNSTNANSNMSQKPQPASKQKGITMEDLKRQTAIRLAQEQKQHGKGYEETTPMPQQQPPPPAPLNNVQNQGYPHNRVPQGETHRDQYTGREVPPQPRPQYAPPPPPPQTYPNQYNPRYQQQQSQGYPHAPQYRPTGGYYDDRGNGMHNNMRHQNSYQGHEMMNNTAYGGGANPRFPRNQQDSYNPNKLTHGLTVHELKQMTRARLQAEAAENVDTDRLSPLDFDSSFQDPPRERTFSRDSTGRGQLPGPSSESTNSIPSLVQVGQGSNGRQVQGSPAGQRQNFNQEYGLQTQQQLSWDGNVQQQHKMDSLDNASTNSYNNSVVSDNLGSESAFSAGIGNGVALSQSDSDFSTGQFNRYGAKENNGRSGIASASASPAAAKQNMFAFDAAVGGNRRRAATLSPRIGVMSQPNSTNPGSILEDRPHFDEDVAIPRFDGYENLAIPSFASAGGVSLLAARSRAHSSSAVLPSDHAAVDDSLFGRGMFGFDDTPNRARTESAVSLPPMSHTGDEFGVDSILSQQMVSQGREGPAAGHNSASSFGDNRQMRAPPGFSDGFGFGAAGRSNSNRSTYTSSAVHDLSDSVGSLLNIAEGGNRERLNTYPQSAKQTPEYISEEFFTKDVGTFRM